MFVRGGYVVPGSGLSGAGYDGTYWSSVGLNRYDAYYLYFGSGSVTPSYSGDRHAGFPVRCVALGG